MVDEELLARIAAAREPLIRRRRPRELKRWYVVCVGNPKNEYEVTGTFRPQCCPGCGGPAGVGDLPMGDQ
jgi:hypothetical protein